MGSYRGIISNKRYLGPDWKILRYKLNFYFELSKQARIARFLLDTVVDYKEGVLN